MGTHNICLYKEVDKKYTGYNLKTMELLDSALIGVCAVIRSNTVCERTPRPNKTLEIGCNTGTSIFIRRISTSA